MEVLLEAFSENYSDDTFLDLFEDGLTPEQAVEEVYGLDRTKAATKKGA